MSDSLLLSDKPDRIGWTDFWLGIANQFSLRATCDRGRSGCVIVNSDNHQITAGYVGSPPGQSHCDDVGHEIKKTIDENGKVSPHCVRTVHAEQNAICQAAKLGISINNSTLYCRMTPCRTCAMLIINCGIIRVVCERKYPTGKESEEMLKKAGIELVFKYDEIQTYE